MRSIATYVVAMSGWALFAAVSQAQAPGFRPAVSPYLNINNVGQSAALNYYGLVRPQLAANRAFQALGSDINALDAQMALNQGNQANQANQLSQTGNVASFMTQGQYFMNNGGLTANRGGQQRPPTKTR